MISRVDSFVLQGIEAIPCEVEADLNPVGLPKTTIVGLPDAAVKESVERVRTALLNSGFRYPQVRLTVNLAPADVRKEGPVYDLPIALAILQADETILSPAAGAGSAAIDAAVGPASHDVDRFGEPVTPARRRGGPAMSLGPAGPPATSDFLVAGELALDGRVRFVRGGTSLAMLAKRLGKRGVIVPRENAAEAAAVDGIAAYGVASLGDAVEFLNGRRDIRPHPPIDGSAIAARLRPPVDFGDIRGQETAKRALTIAAAGGHNILLIGPAGTGKTMMAKALPGVLPPLSREEALEVTRIYSSVGQVPRDEPLMVRRPVRTPHHTASAPAIIGGGSIPRAGDVSLAHRGVLFLDEMPEFSRLVLETLRQPLEDGEVTIARAHGSVRFPARFMLVGALNPTPKGDMATDEASRRAMERYLSTISGPLIDRIDLHIEVPAVTFRELTGSRRGTDTATIRARVLAARETQRRRQGAVTNGVLSGPGLDRFAPLDDAGRTILEQALTELGLSARAYDKIRRVARTIADLESSEAVSSHHVAEAVQYRLLDRSRT